MKKIFTIALVLFAGSGYLSQTVQAQKNVVHKDFKVTTLPGEARNLTPDVAVSARVIKTQGQMYADGTAVSYETLKNKNVSTQFTVKGIRHHALYAANGRWMWTVKSYAGEKLAAAQRDQLFHTYGEIRINWVDEVTTDAGGPVYMVVIANDEGQRRVRILEGNVETVESFATR